jgi:hypothetical protein
MQRALSLTAGAVLSLWSSTSVALEIVLHNVDPPGTGLNDATPVEPVGANGALTLGEQRWLAIQRGADAWREALQGTVPVVVHVTMADLPCGALGASQSGSYVTNVGGPRDDRVYSLALAENLARTRFNADDEADIVLELNGADCDEGPTWYLGFDGDVPPGAQSLVNIAAHELAHGLGFESLVNPADGRALMNAAGLDPFSRLLFDTRTQRYWHELSPEQRRASVTTPRSLVWGGARGRAAALARLREGSPVLDALPSIPGFSGMVTLPALLPRFERVEARVRSVLPADGCSAHPPTTVEHVLLVAEGSCSPSRVAELAAEAGALAVLEVASGERLPPPGFGRREAHGDPELAIPVARIGASDGAHLDADSGASVALFLDPTRLSGADDEGRPFMYTPSQSTLGISLSHWDPSVGPSCLLEPVPAADLRALDVELEKAVLFDLGWADPEEGGTSPASGLVLGGGCSIGHGGALSGSVRLYVFGGLGLFVLRRLRAPKPFARRSSPRTEWVPAPGRRWRSNSGSG